MAENVLNRRVVSDKGVVTYRLLSRLLNCHVNEAKKHLEAFRLKNTETCHATYIVNGTVKAPVTNGHVKASSEDDAMLVDEQDAKEGEPEEVSRTVFELVQEEELEACKARFDTVSSVFVYSLERKRLNDISLVIPANKQIVIDEKCKKNVAASEKGAKFGVIQLPPRKAVVKKKGPLPPTSPMPTRKEDAKPAKKAATKATEKPAVKQEDKPKDLKGKGKATSEDMDLMSWDDAAEEEMLKMEREAAGESQSTTAGEKMEVDGARWARSKPSPFEARTAPAAPAPKQRIRKKRTVKKTVRDEKGNRRTEEVEESYSEDEAEDKKPDPAKLAASTSTNVKKPPAATTQPKKPPPAQGNTQKAKPKTDEHGQTSLKGFFGKPSTKKK